MPAMLAVSRGLVFAALLLSAGCQSYPTPAASPAAEPIAARRSVAPFRDRTRSTPFATASAPLSFAKAFAGKRAIPVTAPAQGKPIPPALPAPVAALVPLDPAPRVVLERPNGGNHLRAGTTEPVRWSAFDTNLDAGSTSIELTRDGGASWALVADWLPEKGTYPWLVPLEPAAAARLRVTVRDRSGHVGRDESDAPFSVEPPVPDAPSGITAVDPATPVPPALRGGLVAEEALLDAAERSRASYREGLELSRAQRCEEAILHLRAAIVLDPDLADAYTALGKVLLDLGRSDEACAPLATGLRVRETPEARVNLGIACYAKGERKRATEEFRRALQLAPELPEAHLYLGMSLADLGEIEDARGHFQKAADLSPDSRIGERARSELARLP